MAGVEGDAHPPDQAGWNLALRFGLEVGALVGLGVGAWQITDTAVAAVAVPIGAAALWGVANVEGDPSRSGRAPVAVPGALRLGVEAVVLGGGAVGFAVAGRPLVAAGFGGLIAIHYGASWSRVRWLLGE